jgi:hypothetical protein
VNAFLLETAAYRDRTALGIAIFNLRAPAAEKTGGGAGDH